MDHHLLDLLALLGILLIVAKTIGGIGQSIGIPSVISELSVGIIVGNFMWISGYSLPLLSDFESSESIKVLSELGVFFLLFVVGLETDIEKIFAVGKDAFLAAVLGIVAPVALAFMVIPYVAPHNTLNHNLFLAAALAATSVGITARVLRDAGSLSSISGQIILGAAVIDDILGIVVLTVVSAMVTSGHVSGNDIALILVKVVAFGVLVAIVRRFFLNKTLHILKKFEQPGIVTVTLLGFCLLSAWLAQKFGLAGIIGAFAVGIILDHVKFSDFKETKKHSIEDLMKPITDFFVPIFFIHIGMSVKIPSLLNPQALTLSVVLIICGIIGKQVCGFALSKKSIAAGGDRMLVGLGMIPRGEVGLIFASIGKSLNVLNEADFGAIVAMVAITTFLPPFLISWRARKIQKAA